MGRYDAVAILHGAIRPNSVRPALAAEAVTTARDGLGDDHYAGLGELGRWFSPADLWEFLLRLAAELPDGMT